jgi:hypothetical protein
MAAVPKSRAKPMIKLASRFMARTFRQMPQRVAPCGSGDMPSLALARLQPKNTR